MSTTRVAAMPMTIPLLSSPEVRAPLDFSSFELKSVGKNVDGRPVLFGRLEGFGAVQVSLELVNGAPGVMGEAVMVTKLGDRGPDLLSTEPTWGVGMSRPAYKEELNVLESQLADVELQGEAAELFERLYQRILDLQ